MERKGMESFDRALSHICPECRARFMLIVMELVAKYPDQNCPECKGEGKIVYLTGEKRCDCLFRDAKLILDFLRDNRVKPASDWKKLMYGE